MFWCILLHSDKSPNIHWSTPQATCFNRTWWCLLDIFFFGNSTSEFLNGYPVVLVYCIEVLTIIKFIFATLDILLRMEELYLWWWLWHKCMIGKFFITAHHQVLVLDKRTSAPLSPSLLRYKEWSGILSVLEWSHNYQWPRRICHQRNHMVGPS